jgi:hypothetical protein
VLDDSKSLVLAKAGREDFVNPEGAPIVYTLKQAGWTVLVDNGDLYKYGPSGLDSPIEHLVAIVGIGANANYVNAHPNTVLRFLSVVWRTFDAVEKLFDLQAPYLNSVAGTSLDGKGVEATVKTLDPFSSFDYDATYFAKTDGVLYYKNAWAAIIADYEAHGIMPKGSVTADSFVWAAPIWQQMVAYRDKTDAIFKSLEGKTIALAKQEMLAKAKQFYAWYDFLDAFRLASVAAE